MYKFELPLEVLVGEELVPPFGQSLFDLVAETLPEFHVCEKSGDSRREL